MVSDLTEIWHSYPRGLIAALLVLCMSVILFTAFRRSRFKSARQNYPVRSGEYPSSILGDSPVAGACDVESNHSAVDLGSVGETSFEGDGGSFGGGASGKW
jgi:uncharacterized membrane protein YgcG